MSVPPIESSGSNLTMMYGGFALLPSFSSAFSTLIKLCSCFDVRRGTGGDGFILLFLGRAERACPSLLRIPRHLCPLLLCRTRSVLNPTSSTTAPQAGERASRASSSSYSTRSAKPVQ